MDPDSFNDLALRVIAREATADERRTLDAELADTPARRDEFNQLRLAHEISRTVSAAHASQPELPAYRVNELRTAVRQHFGPATNREKSSGSIPFLRWIFAGGGVTVLAAVFIFATFSDRSVEVGLYQTDLSRSDESALAPADVPAARIIAFDQDAPFDQWQNQPLAWNQHAKVWIDNEHDLLHIVRRDKDGKTVQETQPLAPTDDAQRTQIKQAVDSLNKR